MSESTDPANGVRALGRRDPAALRAAAALAGQRWLHADCSSADDKAGVLAAIAKGLHLPAHFGMNLDALADCLADLAPPRSRARNGLVVFVEGLPERPAFDAGQRSRLLSVFRDAAREYAARDIGFQVYYTVRR